MTPEERATEIAYSDAWHVLDYVSDDERIVRTIEALDYEELSKMITDAIRQALAAETEQLRSAMQFALNRFDREDTGDGFPRKEIAWAMADDLRTALKKFSKS